MSAANDMLAPAGAGRLPPPGPMPAIDTMQATAAIVAGRLAPLTVRVDREGLYPAEVMRELGAAGAFRHHLDVPGLGPGAGLGAAVEAMAIVSRECLSTGFMVWCQDTCAWYLEHSENVGLRAVMLPRLGTGAALGGTGLSNAVKHFSGIEKLQLQAAPVAGGYVVNGVLPWVSNLGPDHCFGTVFHVDGSSPREVMALVDCASDGFTLRRTPEFTALEGTGTFACQFDDVFIPEERLIADPVGPWLKRVRPGFILLQAGMAIGAIRGCIDVMRGVEPMLGHVNAYLEDRPDELEGELAELAAGLEPLLADPLDTSDERYREVLELRLMASELTLRAAHSAMLHAGARGYQAEAAAQRKLREAYFVAIVTPAIKHLRKELAGLAAD